MSWRSHWLGGIILVVVLAAGMWVRVVIIGSRPLWIDEAESAVNALTILKHGVPTDHYLGLPLYENFPIEEWPESDEYEFKDINYSDRGMAIYHGWFPLYTIAASLALFDIRPDEPLPEFSVLHSDEDIVLRTIVPRLPAVLFSLLFLLLLFQLGREMGGSAAGWSALLAGSFAHISVWFGFQARYYAATLMLITACGIMIWRIIQRGKWRDFLLCGILLVLLFHTQILASSIMVGILILSLIMMRGHQHLFRKVLTTALILFAGAVPWILLTGFLHTLGKIPSVWEFLDFPTYLWLVIGDRLGMLFLFGTLLLFAFVITAFHNRLPQRFFEPFIRHRTAYSMLLIWMLIGFVLFMLFNPATSLFPRRISLLNVVPGILLSSIVLTDACSVLEPRKALLLPPAIIIVFLAATGMCIGPRGITKGSSKGLQPLIQYLRDQDFEPSTRLYTWPNNHLVLQYYTGLPVQSIAPVRKSYLDNYNGTVVFIDRIWLDPLPEWRMIQQAAELDKEAEEISESEAKQWAQLLRTRLLREELVERVCEVDPPLRELPEYLKPIRAMIEERRSAWIERSHDFIESQLLLFKDQAAGKLSPGWQTFFYWFVDPASRSGPNVNYADRMLRARAVILPDAACVVYYSYPIPDSPCEDAPAVEQVN